MSKIVDSLKEDWRSFSHLAKGDAKHTLKCFLVIAAILFTAFNPLFSLGYDYIDDIGRNLRSSDEWGRNFMRWITYIENYLIQMNLIKDSSPLTQYIATIFLAAATTVMASVFSAFEGRRIGAKHVVASLLLAFNPYFLECMSYKYDSVGMATSVFVSLVPFLFIRQKHLFAASSIACNLLMALSYQSSSGIYIIMVILLGLAYYAKEDDWSIPRLLKFYLVSAICYLVPVGLFYITLSPFMATYRSVAVDPVGLSTVSYNVKQYFSLILSDFSITWKIAIALLAITTIVAFVTFPRKEKRVQAAVLSIIALALSAVMSYGAFIILNQAATEPRMIYGIGVLLAIMANISVCASISKKAVKTINMIPAFILAWSFFAFTFIYSNMLESQMEHERMYEQMIIADLNNLLPHSTEKYNLGIANYAGHSPLVIRTSSAYPILNRIVPSMLATYEWSWGGFRLVNYYTDNYTKLSPGTPYSRNEYSLLKETQDYDILGSGNNIVVEFK